MPRMRNQNLHPAVVLPTRADSDVHGGDHIFRSDVFELLAEACEFSKGDVVADNAFLDSVSDSSSLRSNFTACLAASNREALR